MGLFDFLRGKNKKKGLDVPPGWTVLDMSGAAGTVRVIDRRSDKEKEIEKMADKPLSPALEAMAEEIVTDFDIGMSLDDMEAKYQVRARDTQNIDELTQIYYRVIALGKQRGVQVIRDYMGYMFSGIHGWLR